LWVVCWSSEHNSWQGTGHGKWIVLHENPLYICQYISWVRSQGWETSVARIQYFRHSYPVLSYIWDSTKIQNQIGKF
jgi:hypothetical protein